MSVPEMSMEHIENIITCPICLDIMASPIMQCNRGHSMCGACLTSKINKCPFCRETLNNPMRNHNLEEIIDGMKKVVRVNCLYSNKGCQYDPILMERDSHQLECKFRNFQCEGKKFAKWNCNWSGELSALYKHFKDCHNSQSWMQYRTEAYIKMCLTQDFVDTQVISFFHGQEYFYYKHKVDVAKSKVYWVIQYVGMRSRAQQYLYEFEIFNGPVQKYKVTELCENDVVDANELFAKEQCVVISFDCIKSFLNDDGELAFKFRIMLAKNALRQ